jgi:hypothetical protein
MTVAETIETPNHLKCPCTRTEIRRRTLSSGVVIFALQCLGCGRQIRAVKKDSLEVRALTDARPFDETLQDAWRERVSAFYENRRLAQQAQREQENADWWARYNAYLKTTEWRLKRQAVLTRANNWCEGCAARQATQVHHLRYDHMGDELLFELVAVCDECHKRIHPHMDSR